MKKNRLLARALRGTAPRMHVLAALVLLAPLLWACDASESPTQVEEPSYAMSPPINTANSQVLALASYVEGLVEDGSLGRGQANALIALLARVGVELDADDEAGAAPLLIALGNLIDAYVESGALSQADAAPLRNSVEGLTTDGIALASITAGERHACGLTPEGSAYCWGANDFGQLGTGTNSPSNVPVAVSGGITFASLDAVGGVTCGVTPGGQAFCWGNNGGAQLGNGTTTDSNVPTPVAGGLSFTELSLGWSHVCALVASGEAYCWGSAAQVPGREFGLGFTPPEPCAGPGGFLFPFLCATTPTPVPTGLRFTSIGSGLWHTCAVGTDGNAYCWGWNSSIFCQLGLGEPCSTSASTPVPQPVVGGAGLAEMVSGSGANCALDASGVAVCWGYGMMAGSTSDGVPTATPLPGAVAFAMVDLSGENRIWPHACGVAKAGEAYCWGGTADLEDVAFGNLGDGLVSTDRCTFGLLCTTEPSPVFGGITFAQVAVGLSFSCGVSTTGETWCWGVNDEGQLGTGNFEGASTPVRVVAG